MTNQKTHAEHIHPYSVEVIFSDEDLETLKKLGVNVESSEEIRAWVQQTVNGELEDVEDSLDPGYDDI